MSAAAAVIRSYLFVPGDSERKFERAMAGNADALILDLEDSVAPAQKVAGRDATRRMLAAPRAAKRLYVRVNAFDTGLTLADLAAVMPAAPDGIVLPKCGSVDDVRRLDHYLDALEAAAGRTPGDTRILVIATETPQALFALGGYRGGSARLSGMMWGAEDLSAALGASANRDADGFLSPYRMARDLCLAGAMAAGVDPVDTVAVDIDDLDGLRRETIAARRDGFVGKAVIHPKHVDVVNDAFMPTEAELDWARRVVDALADGTATGTVKLDGKMIDQPHLRTARRLLALSRR